MFVSIQIRSARAKTYILGIWQDTKRVPTALSHFDEECKSVLSGHNFSGKCGETSRVGSVMFVGLGKKSELKRDGLRGIGGSIVRALDAAGVSSAEFATALDHTPRCRN